MADTNTTALGLLKMEVDSHENDWGEQLNVNFDEIDEAIAGQSVHNTTGGTTTLDIDDVRPPFHRVTGTLASNATIEVPAANPKLFFWKNETTGNFTTTVKVNGQTGVVVPQGETKLLRCNGTDVVDGGLFREKYATAVGGTVDAITVTTNLPAFGAYSTAMRFRFTSAGMNTVTNPTINVDGLGAKTVKKWGNVALRKGEIGEAGHVCECTYDGTSIILLNPAGRYETIKVAISDQTTAIATGTAKVSIPMKACKVQAVRAFLLTAQASGNIFTIDINEDTGGGATTILSTKLTIDNTEHSSETAATPAVISDPDLADDCVVSFDVDQIGNGSAIGCIVEMDVRYAS
ncbi:MAG: hypothetical protein AB7O44_30330 [Hyphomicrobiaceae bacterium]